MAHILTVLNSRQTVSEIWRSLSRRHLMFHSRGRIKHQIYFPSHRSGPLKDTDILSEIGIANLSTLYVRTLVPGGAAKDSDHANDPGPSSSKSRRFGKRTGVFESSNARHWDYVPESDHYRCLVCPPGTFVESKYIKRHEKSERHRSAVSRREGSSSLPGPSLRTNTSAPRPAPAPPTHRVRTALTQMLDDIAKAPHDPSRNAWINEDLGVADWGAGDMDVDFTLQPTMEVHAMIQMAENARQYLLDPHGLDDDSDAQVDERPSDEDSEHSSSSSSESEDEPGPSAALPRTYNFKAPKRKVSDDTAQPYFPWPDRETCVLDILRHIPRCAFSRKQNTAIHWAMMALGLEDLPSDRVMDGIDRSLQDLCGIQSLRYAGALGHIYYINDMAAIIAQEMANPNVRKHLKFYAEDAGSKLSEAWQAERWKSELDSSLTTPMIRAHSQDFFIDEVTLLKDATACMPFRWFTRGDQMFARAWKVVSDEACSGWIVDTTQEREYSSAELLLSHPQFVQSHQRYNLPDPREVIGLRTAAGGILPWTKPSENPWRIRSKGHRVLALPLWLYCDDTSGNLSKKWNKHNSFLFTLAGLPRRFVHRESNIHFLSTSNIAPPLEMLDGIVNQLEACQKDGVWAWDCDAQERVLLIPSVLAMLGDNPMQSEFACHIGLRGRLFCRVCKVEGRGEGELEEDGRQEKSRKRADSDTGSEASSMASDTSDASNASPKPTSKKRRKKGPESMTEMIGRVTNFMKIGILRNGRETQALLRSQFTEACRVGGLAQFKRTRTSSGVKDMYQETLLERLFDASTQQGVTKAQKEKDLKAAQKSLPEETTSPVWRIKDLDPHSDTPVEILHVILLGFVKYFWRDAMARLKDHQKDVVIARLSSANTSGLGFPALSGSTLVKYSGSLTGRDFRAIAQVAPFVLHGFLEKDILECWNALARLMPLVWQPKIEKLADYIDDVEKAIDHFLDCACRVTPRWFNKPKFHILLHLPAHIKRFGPAMLFATEGFESFNAIIRAASVHSNRHAPSRDIAHVMARGNRVRHLLSGGFFLMNRLSGNERLRWETVSQAAVDLTRIGNFGSRVLGLEENEPDLPSGYCSSHGQPLTWAETCSRKQGVVAPIICGSLAPLALSNLVHTPRKTTLPDGDVCQPGDWVIWSSLNSQDSDSRSPVSHIGQIFEIVQVVGSQRQRENKCDFVVVVATTSSAEPHSYYHMPKVRLNEASALATVDINVAIRCIVNVQHNCADHPCAITASSTVYQEREETSQRAPAVTHASPDDLILNTAQMRNSIALQPFRADIAPLDRQRIVFDSVKLEFDLRKKKEAEKALGLPRARRQGSSLRKQVM
ncbi:hypothetical protein BOTBODRAFT_182352 [Botryobasidium botryosum FD-172 SS1]|uniref:Uncharacterized protein n=1 Tax=Botryobasidium botryosum (strain FD-172 SS1) TaxID=930990 RepID=A0A067LTU5_BOTB1|nr:hypothetical protein BOTBODRAFT_182352 [Botryobasidium botryosum FD-172 SS1]